MWSEGSSQLHLDPDGIQYLMVKQRKKQPAEKTKKGPRGRKKSENVVETKGTGASEGWNEGQCPEQQRDRGGGGLGRVRSVYQASVVITSQNSLRMMKGQITRG